MLLGALKEDHKREEGAGIVPKDLGLGFIKDLIEFEGEEEQEKQRKREDRKDKEKKLKNQKSFKY